MHKFDWQNWNHQTGIAVFSDNRPVGTPIKLAASRYLISHHLLEYRVCFVPSVIEGSVFSFATIVHDCYTASCTHNCPMFGHRVDLEIHFSYAFPQCSLSFFLFIWNINLKCKHVNLKM